METICSYCGQDHVVAGLCDAAAARDLMARCFVCCEHQPLEDLAICPSCGQMSCQSEMCEGQCRCTIHDIAESLVATVAPA